MSVKLKGLFALSYGGECVGIKVDDIRKTQSSQNENVLDDDMRKALQEKIKKSKILQKMAGVKSREILQEVKD